MTQIILYVPGYLPGCVCMLVLLRVDALVVSLMAERGSFPTVRWSAAELEDGGSG